MNKIWNRLPRFLKDKYVITMLVFLIWLFFFDQFNLLDRLDSMRNLKQLQQDKAYYQKRIREDSQRLKELKTNRENLEKFAREQYLMKKDNEDIFVIVDKD